MFLLTPSILHAMEEEREDAGSTHIPLLHTPSPVQLFEHDTLLAPVAA
jgi:hypothetical protein